MNRLKYRLFILLLGMLWLTACAPKEDFAAGKPLTRDELASLSAELFTEAAEPETMGNRFSSRVVVYWTEGGGVYHYDRNCYHLKRADAVESGSVKHAWSLGKERACSVCGGE